MVQALSSPRAPSTKHKFKDKIKTFKTGGRALNQAWGLAEHRILGKYISHLPVKSALPTWDQRFMGWGGLLKPE